MYLKALELHGFKSFPNRTTLNFERGATVVVGPNGSGKSNISDAMRWVLGEVSSRNIRGTKMEDVIFGGTDARRPMGFAEVSVTFDNSDKDNRIDSPYDEITVTRRYYRSGDSEYLINSKPVRLRDIQELFMNTGIGREGYSIVGQGKVAEMLSRKSEDRRNFFEEAAGISKFRHRKEETERKLERVDENMVRAQDILNELEAQVGPLERDAEKARKYLELFEQKKRADVSLWLYDTQKIRADVQKAEADLRASTEQHDRITSELRALESESDELYEQVQKNMLEAESLGNQMDDSTRRLNDLDKAYEVAQNNIGHQREMIAQCKTRLTELEQLESAQSADEQKGIAHIDALKERAQQIQDERLGVLAEQQQITAEIQKLDEALESDLAILNEKRQQEMNLRVRIDVLRKNREQGSDKGEELLAEIAQYEGKCAELGAEAERCRAGADDFTRRINESTDAINALTEESESLRGRREELIDKKRALQLQAEAERQRADTLRRMEEQLEGYSEGVRYVVREYEAGRIKGAGKVYGPLSQLIDTEARYLTAVETSLGASVQHIVTDNEETVRACIAALKENHAGRATFYPITAIQGGTDTPEIRRCEEFEGYVDRADRLVRTEEKFRAIVEWLLIRTVVFDTLEHATAAAKKLQYKVKLVTLDGQVINAGGSYTGGSVRKDGSFLSRTAQIERCLEAAKRLNASLETIEAEDRELSDKIAELTDRQRDEEQKRDLLLSMSRAQFAALDQANARKEANDSLLSKLRQDYDTLLSSGNRDEEELKVRTAELEGLVSACEEIRRRREETEIRKNGRSDARDERSEQANQLYIAYTEVRKDIEAAEGQIAHIRERVEELHSEREARQSDIRAYEMKIEELLRISEMNRKNYETFARDNADTAARRAEIESRNLEINRKREALRAKTKEKNDEKELAYRAKSACENKYNNLVAEQDKLGTRLWDDYEIGYEEAIALDYPPITRENRSEVAQLQSTCRAKIRALGSVNVGAIEQYAEIKERYDSYKTQVTDMNNAHKELTEILMRLEDEMRTNFSRAFEAINEKFGVVFAELFGGGQAELSLTDPSDVLTSGIEIKAAPPGKIITSLSLLSGGEQALVAVALLFAILKVNPTPFCILDEIEAALDEVNVARFGEYVKKLSGETQFVLITHRRGTMEVADKLYGVTMPERGISRVLPLDVSEIESKKKELIGDGIL